MNQIVTTEQRQVTPAQQVRIEIEGMGDEFGRALLGTTIPQEKFMRVVMTAILSDPDVLAADRRSLLEAATRAAQDGLLPDKREGAFVVFAKKVQWMPMIGGIIKKIHQSGDVGLITAKVVYGGDNYRTWVDDNGEHVIYEPAELPDYDTIRQVFAMAKTKDGSVYVEALTPRDIEKIRSVSRSKDKGPWVQWWEEMAKKSAIRRLAKRLPLAAEVHDLLQRDNELYDLSRAPDPRPNLLSRLQAHSATQEPQERKEGFDPSHVARETANASSGPAIEQEQASSPAAAAAGDVGSGTSEETDTRAAADPSGVEPGTKAGADGMEARAEPGAPSAPAANEKAMVNPVDKMNTDFLKAEMVRKIVELAGNKELSVQDRLEELDQLKPDWLSRMPGFSVLVGQVFVTAGKVVRGELSPAKATQYLNGLPVKKGGE